MPNQSSRVRMPAALRIVLFWTLVMALGVFLWRVDLKPGGAKGPHLFLDVLIGAIVVAVWVLTYAIWWKIQQRRRNPSSHASRPLG
jgi:hypothetical protein